ncbi:MAG: peptidyl-prolyl cis-trans isomerase [Acidobacteria bacterium]|nr:peptidyl-prolyl cis-trans isomerase [Acidobacteriota bacterium]
MKRLTNSVFGKLVLMVIIVGMAFFGVNSAVDVIRGGLGANVAQAGTRGFDPSDLDRRVESVPRNMNATSEKPITKSEALENGMIDQIFQSETARITMLGYGAGLGLAPSTDAVLAQTKSIEAFQNPLTGELDATLLRQRLSQLGFTLHEFEEQIADDLTIQSMQEAATAAVVAPQVLTGVQTLYFGETRNVSWFFFDALKGTPEIAPTPEEVKAYYDTNLEQLKQPERRGLDLLRMSAEDFLGEVEVTDQEIATIYEATKSERFSDPDQRTYAELLFDNRDAARNAFGVLAGGGDPNAVGGAVSNVLKTARAADVSDPALRDAMFGAGKQSGAMFGPREVNGRWMVARLISVQPGPVKPLEEVADIIRDELAGERAQIVFAEKMDRLDEVLAAGYDLEQISAELKVPVFSFAPVDARGVTDRGMQFGALNEASDAVAQAFRLAPGEVTSRFDTPNAIMIAVTREIIPPSTPAFEDIADDVRSVLIAERRNSAAQEAVNGLVDRIGANSETFEQAAAAAGATIESLPQSVTRSSASQAGIPGPIQQAMFSTAQGKVVSLPTATANQFVILKVTSVEPPSESAMAGIGTELTAATSNALGQDLVQALQAEIAASTKLRINQGALDTYKRTISETP